MNPDAMATRLSVLTRALPMRILLVDDDELELELLSDRLRSAGFQAVCTANGEQALAELAKQWYPLVITDWQMPIMDGIALTETLRSRGFLDTYVIMLTMRGANVDYERGYLAGVDDYLTKKVPDAELFARIHGAFNTLALRRSLKETQNALEESVSIDADSGAFAPRELTNKLHSEIRRAQRYGRNLSLIVLNAMLPGGAAPAAETLRGIVQVVDASIRAHVDFVGRIEAPAGASFAVVLPEATVGDAPVINERILTALRQYTFATGVELFFSLGVSALDRSAAEGVQVEAKDLLQVAVHCLNCPGRAGQEQLRAVQSSVACHASIVCRHGYAVDDECSMKAAVGRRVLEAVG
jgi:PleD family two-component response regulator